MTISQFPLPEGGIPTGNTAGRPASPVIGDVYYNGQIGVLEIYDGTNWVPCSAPPGIPTVVVADVGTSRAYGSGGISYTFTSSTLGGAPIGYTGNATIGGTTYTTGSTTNSVVTLTVGNNGTYSTSGSAFNGFGPSANSVSANLDVTTVPQAPTIGTASVSGTTSDVTITWTLGNSGGKNLTSITITPYLNGTTAQTAQTAATTSSTSKVFTGLTQGSSYTFKVKATNANGDSLESSATNSITVPNMFTTDFLVIAGGGGGGGAYGGGGGAGGYRTSAGTSGGGASAESSFSLGTGFNFTVTVGAGGNGGSGANPSTGSTNGSDSIFYNITSVGGGKGTGVGNPGSSGGSGGGGTAAGGFAGTANQGYAGGSRTGGNGLNYPNGGGGGAGAVGGDGINGNTSGNGGTGVSSDITGSSVTRGGGGGGGTYRGGTAGTGGSGGGGAGGSTSQPSGGNGNAGSANTGGGGGSASSGNVNYDKAGGNGGSGVVILRYPDTRTITIGAGLTGSESSASGGYKRATITAGSGNVSWS